MLGHRITQVADAVEGEEPDAQGVHVVLNTYALEEVVVSAAVDVMVDALVEFDEDTHIGIVGICVDGGKEVIDDLEILNGPSLRCQACGVRLELFTNLRQGSEVARIEGGDEHASAWVDVDEALMGQGAQCLPDRCPSQAQPLLQIGLAEQGTRGQFEGDDECPNVPVGVV